MKKMLIFAALKHQNFENMETTVRRRTARRLITHYWGMLKDLDDNQKLQLITMLAESVKSAKTEPKKKKLDACDYAGIWSDEEYMDADELVDHLNEVRHTKSHRQEFWDKFFSEP